MNRDIREELEGWAHWRHYRNGGYGKTMTEKFIEGMPGTRCPACAGRGKRGHDTCATCHGAGQVHLAPASHEVSITVCPRCERGEINGRTCVACRGSGYRTTIEAKINPAHIRSTYQSPDYPIYERIDRLVCELRRRDQLLGYYFVIWAEYCDSRGGTQAIKAQRLLLKPDCYESRLRRAVGWIGLAVNDRRACDTIPFPYKAAEIRC